MLEYVSENGEIYYYHKATNSTQWDKPETCETDGKKQKMQKQSKPKLDETEIQDDQVRTGKVKKGGHHSLVADKLSSIEVIKLYFQSLSNETKMCLGGSIMLFMMVIIIICTLASRGTQEEQEVIVTSQEDRVQTAELSVLQTVNYLDLTLNSGTESDSMWTEAELVAAGVDVGNIFPLLQIQNEGLPLENIACLGNHSSILPFRDQFQEPGWMLETDREPLPFIAYSANMTLSNLSDLTQKIPITLLIGVADLTHPEQVNMALIFEGPLDMLDALLEWEPYFQMNTSWLSTITLGSTGTSDKCILCNFVLSNSAPA